MPKYPMTEVIAFRDYTLASGPGHSTIHVELGKPARAPEDSRSWYCPWTITKAGDVHPFSAVGVDPLQALLLGLSSLRANLDLIAREGRLMLEGQQGTFIQLVE